MEVIVVGLNHRTAPIALRECLAFQEDKLPEALQQANALPTLKENMILSTCNRVENLRGRPGDGKGCVRPGEFSFSLPPPLS